MDEKQHSERVNRYFKKSRLGYDLLLWGAKHFGFYPSNRRVNEKQAQAIMQDLIADRLKLTKTDLVLDAGCGQGVVSTYIAKKIGCRIEGVTIVGFEIGEANKLAKKRGMANLVKYHLMDYTKMAYPDARFDAIYAIETLCHTPDIYKALREFHRVLKKGGRLALFEYSLANDEEFTDHEMIMLNRVARGGAAPSLIQMKASKWPELIKKAGFKEIKVEDIRSNIEPSLNRFRKLALLPYISVRLFGLQETFPNVTIAVELHRMVKSGKFKYWIITAKK